MGAAGGELGRGRGSELRRLGEPGVPLVQPGADVVRRVGASLPLAAGEHDTGCRHAGQAGQSEELPEAHDRNVARVAELALDKAVELTRTGDVWVFRGPSLADRAIRAVTNAPVNHVGMAVVLEDMPPLLWHAELGKSLPDAWTGQHQRGVQLHDLHDAVVTWRRRYGQRAWMRQLVGPAEDGGVTPQMEDAVLRTIARLDGKPFPTTRGLVRGWVNGRLRRSTAAETVFCAELVAATYTAMELLPGDRPLNAYDPGSFWSGDDLELLQGAKLGPEIPVDVPLTD
ncbi:MAG: uncharacterized protein JWQ37_170 [Blastococcus sp.]|nr:uncharacterized protein [Blastococcus sp.]